MNFALSLILILVILVIYMIMINIFSIFLRISGVPTNIARFQGISLFTNCGYTTSESETITNAKLRRKVATVCMITGNFFSVIIVSLIVNIISSFSIEYARQTYEVALVAVGIFVAIMVFFQIPKVKKGVEKLIQEIVDNRIEKQTHDNVITIVDNFAGNAIIEIYLNWVPDALYNKTIHESKLKVNYGINLLSIKRNKRKIEITRNTQIQQHDVLLVFGTYAAVRDLFSVKEERAKAIAEHAEDAKHFNEIDLIDNYGANAMVEVKLHVVPTIIEGKTLNESMLREKFGINVVFIKRNNEVVEVRKDTILQNGDLMVVFGPFQAIKNVFIY